MQGPAASVSVAIATCSIFEVVIALDIDVFVGGEVGEGVVPLLGAGLGG